ncbi:LysM peptidoglycan-binding domain-containing protein [Undibacterium parvum]|uniref:LysM peptidoglycan-binding domain-containing protein n=2 Tax=Undibacterium parvum TaxID=401471 RepID=A0A3Q9BTW9_9BURK|nr:LysM peptidoglycan-binding domain-containing protein [Undibacterium parvum]
MHNDKRLPMSSLGRKVLSAAVASTFLLFSDSNATGLGKLTVLSALGQPLRAEIELTSPDKDEISSLVPKLASAEAFRQSSIDFNPALLSLRFAVESRGAGYVIRLSSTQAMNEPFVDLLLEMNSNNGKLLREYTFLLDPAELRSSQSAQVANPVSVTSQNASVKTASQSKSQAASSSVATQATPSVATVTPKKTVDKSVAVKDERSTSDYQVKRGDTLGKIAEAHRGDGVSLDQMLVGLYKANPQAFSGNNMNRLKSGQILSIPDASEVRSNSGSESRSVVMAHAADFTSYRNKLAGQVADAPAQKTVESKQSVSGSITAKVKEVPTASNESLDKLKLSKATTTASSKTATGKVTVDEDKLAKDRAVADANARVKELEKNVGDLQKILELKNKDLAEKQSAASAKAVANVVAPTSASKPEVQAPAPAAVVSAASAPDVSASAVATPIPPVKKKVAPPPPPPPPESNWYDNWSDWLLPGTVVLALLGGVGLWSSRRNKKTQQFDDSVLTGSSMKANSMFGSTGGQSVDTNNSVFNSNFAPSASQLDANEVDPVAEADVYIAYGRDSQAEEILKEALRTQPERHAVRVKLLEIYFSRKDPRSFERLASELYGMTSGEGDEWAQAISMGVTLEPTNPLYAGGKSHSDFSGGSAALGASTQPQDDLDPESLLGNSLSQDMLDSISIIDTASGLTEDPNHPNAEFVSTKDSNLEPILDIDSLDFDLDMPDIAPTNELDVAPAMLSEVSEVAVQKSVVEESSVDFGVIDFDFGSSDADVKVATVEDNAGSLKSEVSEFKSASLVDENNLAFESSSTENSLDFSGLKAEHDLVMPTDNADAALASAPSAFEFDLSGINLDLGSDDLKLDIPVSTNDDVSSYNAEMATKLDLAVAYQEIGDKEGARELLDEVLKGGTSDQIEKAKAMLSQLI